MAAKKARAARPAKKRAARPAKKARAYARMLDPKSVVRKGEYASTARRKKKKKKK
jgi:hypothetical protein